MTGGHQVSDHTMTHPLNLPQLSAARMKVEIGDAHDRVAQLTGVAPKFFRSPGGAWSTQVLDTAAERGMIRIDWAVDPRDWARPGTSRIIQRACSAPRPATSCSATTAAATARRRSRPCGTSSRPCRSAA